MGEMSPPPGRPPHLVVRAAAGGRGAVVELFERYRTRLRRMVALRLDLDDTTGKTLIELHHEEWASDNRVAPYVQANYTPDGKALVSIALAPAPLPRSTFATPTRASCVLRRCVQVCAARSFTDFASRPTAGSLGFP